MPSPIAIFVYYCLIEWILLNNMKKKMAPPVAVFVRVEAANPRRVRNHVGHVVLFVHCVEQVRPGPCVVIKYIINQL